MNKRTNSILLAVGAAILIALPFVSPTFISPYYLDLMTKVLIFGIALLGYDILAGYTGLVSLGHALFFGVGGYCTAYIATQYTTNLLSVLLFALLVTWVIGIVVGYFSTQTKDIFFVFLTLAFAQFFYLAAFNLTTITGGDNGITIPKMTLGIPYVWQTDMPRPFAFYFLVLAVFLARPGRMAERCRPRTLHVWHGQELQWSPCPMANNSKPTIGVLGTRSPVSAIR